MSEKYTLRYLPIFQEDLNNVIRYISQVLKNPHAANALLDELEKSILERLPVAESFEIECIASSYECRPR